MTKEYRLIKELDTLIDKVSSIASDQHCPVVIRDLENCCASLYQKEIEIKEHLTRLDGASRFNEVAMREAIDSITEVVDLDSN